MTKDEFYMQRCFDLARLGAGSVSPNPMVGAVLVHDGRIIGEGWHQKYGEAHAEVNAVRNVAEMDRHLIATSTLYVSLEPCCVFGRTPPCTDLIIQHKIPKVVISCLDQTPGVAGTSVRLLREQGVEVVTGILEEQGKAISRIRNHFVTHQRPYVILKYAQTPDGYIGKVNEQAWISNAYAKRLVHKWRSEMDAILIGTNTARTDNPQLTNRLYFGKSPIRVILDRKLTLSESLNVFDESVKTLIFTEQVTPNLRSQNSNRTYIQMNFQQGFLPKMLANLHDRKITSLLVEGGSTLLQSFVNAQLWNEALVFVGERALSDGVPAPRLRQAQLEAQYRLKNDQLLRFQQLHNR